MELGMEEGEREVGFVSIATADNHQYKNEPR